MKRNWLRGIGIALILMPEPFTTPFGITLLALSFALRRKHKDTLRYMETLVKRYRNTMESGGFSRFSKVYTSPARSQSRVFRHETPWHDHIDRQARTQYQYYYANGSHRVNNRIVRRVLNTGIPQYSLSTAGNGAAPHMTSKVVLPPPAGEFYTGLRPIKPVPQPKIIHHTLRRV